MGNKAWSILFGVVMAGCAIGFGIAPFMGWWMPEGASTHAWDVDFLFYVILGIVAFFFFLTEGILIAFMWQFGSKGETRTSVVAGMPNIAKSVASTPEDQHRTERRLELAWTFVPAVILLYIAFAQVGTWENIKYESRHGGKAGEAPMHQVAISARQFEWRIRYPSVARFQKWSAEKNPVDRDYTSFGKVPQVDDIHVVNELHVWKPEDEKTASATVIFLTSRDVIHSFNLPNFRVKQDALPGKLIPVWFTPTTANCTFDKKKKRWLDGVDPKTGEADSHLIYDIPCAELCGWGHYRMIGRVFVHETQKDFLEWLKSAEASNKQRTRD